MVRRAIATYGQHEPQEPQEAQATPAPEGARDDWWQQGGNAAQGAAWGEWHGGGESPDQGRDDQRSRDQRSRDAVRALVPGEDDTDDGQHDQWRPGQEAPNADPDWQPEQEEAPAGTWNWRAAQAWAAPGLERLKEWAGAPWADDSWQQQRWGAPPADLLKKSDAATRTSVG